MAGPTITAAVLAMHQGRVPSAAESDPKPEVVEWCASAGGPKGMLGVWTGQARLHIRRASFMQASRWGRNVSIAAALTCGELGLGVVVWKGDRRSA
jgi:hypothetical protein